MSRVDVRVGEGTSRRVFLGSVGLVSAGSLIGGLTGRASAAGAAQRPGMRLHAIPSTVFKATAPKEGFETWVFNLVLESPSSAPVRMLGLRLAFLSGEKTLKTVEIGADAVAAMQLLDQPIPSRTSREAQATSFWPVMLRVRHVEPASLAINGLRATLMMADAESGSIDAHIPIAAYTQSARLGFPFVGAGMVTQAGSSQWGHRNRSGQFAIDVLGLTDLYAPMIGNWGPNSALAGWGRPIIAPAAGTVVVARGDRPDQPEPGNSNPKYYVPEFPDGGDPGNFVVIDHGHAEFSMLAHLQEGSVAVAVGQRVEAGQPLGKLGNSGDSTSPHLHYQLMNGPDWEFADALPHVFDKFPRGLQPGGYFSA